MSDPKRASLITVGEPKSGKNKVTKTVRITVNLDESNESKYPVLNYKELLKAAVRRQRVENGKTGLDPFSDNDDDVEMVARKFEQKYGGKSTYGRKGRSKREDFADIGAGYDENDSFIDNTHGYDEMVPPECDTIYGGFYINCGSLEFKTVQENQNSISDAEQHGSRRNKRRISSSSSEEESSDSSSDSDSQDAKDPQAIANGTVDSHKTEHRKKKNNKIDKKKAKKIRRTDSSAATSGKQTSDDNAHHGDGESADSRTSQSDSLTSKPAPSSENAATSDSSRDVEPKVEVKLPAPVVQVLEELEAAVSRQLSDNPNVTANELLTTNEPALLRIERVLSKCSAEARVRRAAVQRAALALRTSRAELLRAVRARLEPAPDRAPDRDNAAAPSTATVQQSPVAAAPASTVAPSVHKRKLPDALPDLDISNMTPKEKEAKIVETLQILNVLIEEKKPSMITTYNAECKRVQEERKKIQIASAAEGAPHIEKRLPKRRFPWCPRSCALLARLARLAPDTEAAAALLAARALPLFPSGFVRMPTLLRQAGLSKEMKALDSKRQRVNSTSQPVVTPTQVFPDQPIQFPSILTVTSIKSTDKTEIDEPKYKVSPETVCSTIISAVTKELDRSDERKKDLSDKKQEDLYIPPSIGSITITPVPSQKTDRKVNNTLPVEKPKDSFLRVISPAALNEMAKKDKEKQKKIEKVNTSKDKRVESPLHVDTSYQTNKKEPSPKTKLEEINPKQIEAMRLAENNIPRPALIAKHTPPIVKPDKRQDVKKKKDLFIMSDVDPLADVQQETVDVEDSSNSVELVEEKTDLSECASDNRSDIVPSKDKVSAGQKNPNSVRERSFSLNREQNQKDEQLDEKTKALFDTVNTNLRELQNSQEPTKLNCNSYSDTVINSAKHEIAKETFKQRTTLFGKHFSRTDSYERY
ncbi:uncharacterized protein [Epargyreus clarus]|uniref:uncharacterized protein n=1 Tax=Epargyreus clarus TaxID=520877 RepID=UPI003C302EF8